MAKKTWIEKLNVDKKAEVKVTDSDFADIPAGSKMLIATPRIFDEYVRQIPKGKSVSLQTIRKDLAVEYGAEYTCPLTTGIFMRIVSEAAYEQYQQGKALTKITPFWRAVEPGSSLGKKLSFGQEFLIEQRKREGIEESKLKSVKKKK